MGKRVILIVLDSCGIGGAKDAAAFGDEGSHTLAACSKDSAFSIANMRRIGMGCIKDALPYDEPDGKGVGAWARLEEASMGKDTTIGHWEIAGIISPDPMPTYPNGFPEEVISEFEEKTGRKALCNKPYSGTEVIRDYGQEHVKTGDLIVYTSADSVFQIAAHEDVVPVKELYRYCEIARKMLVGKHGVGRVIARPFIGEYPNYERTSNRHDFSIEPPRATLLDDLTEAKIPVFGVGKIFDIFAGKGVGMSVRTSGNEDGIEQTLGAMDAQKEGLIFVNLVDFDMLYGHRNDVHGYAEALTYFDDRLPEILSRMQKDDILMITADHGCDPSTPSTDHSRENVPFLAYGERVRPGTDLGTRSSFADIAKTIGDYFGINTTNLDGESFWKEMRKK
ncbi:MAG: phosphopentomutase [Clostridiales bacterium]|nr:phosphopentomutase [Clostridiales bacterium]